MEILLDVMVVQGLYASLQSWNIDSWTLNIWKLVAKH